MKVTLNVWRQTSAESDGEFERYEDVDIDEDASFLEMLDVLNDRLLEAGERPSLSTTTAARGSAARARCSSTTSPMARAR